MCIRDRALTYAGAALALWLRRRSLSAEALVPAVIVFGGLVFHTFWEAKSLYIWSYAIMMRMCIRDRDTSV